MPWDKGDVNRMLPRKCPKLLKSIIRQKNCKKKRGVRVCGRSFTSTHGEVALVPLERKTLEISYS